MYKISEVSKMIGFSVPTLRYYEELGISAPAKIKAAIVNTVRPISSGYVSFTA